MSKISTSFFLVIFIFSLGFSSYSQRTKNRANLEREKRLNLEKIASVKRILNQTIQDKHNTVGKIKALQEQIKNHEVKINLANDETDLIKSEIATIKINQAKISNEIKSIQKEYALMLYNASKKSNQMTKIGFLFSARSINDLLRRYKYLDQYTENRKKQLEKINELNQQYIQRNKELELKKSSQMAIVKEITDENNNLVNLKENQKMMVGELSKKEGELKIEIEKSKLAVSNLNNLISNIITKNNKEGIGNSAKTEVNSTEAPININTTETVVAKKENFERKTVKGSNFSTVKNRLNWPASGFISDHFGVKNHPVLQGVKIVNNGIDIQTESNAPVFVVFSGKVLDISEIPGLNFVVAVQHGEYYTVYANLENVSVKINDEVNQNQKIGNAGKKDGASEINFQIWHNFDKLNPENWLSNK